jgi:hypothetical protein
MSYGDNSSYGGGAPSGTPVNGTLILVLGILGIVLCQILGPIAWIMGNNAVRVPGGDPQQANLANIGRILGIIGTVFLILGVLWAIFFGAAFFAAMSGVARSTPPSSF